MLNRLEVMEPANGFLLLMIRNDERNRGGWGLERDEDRSRENNESIDEARFCSHSSDKHSHLGVNAVVVVAGG